MRRSVEKCNEKILTTFAECEAKYQKEAPDKPFTAMLPLIYRDMAGLWNLEARESEAEDFWLLSIWPPMHRVSRQAQPYWLMVVFPSIVFRAVAIAMCNRVKHTTVLNAHSAISWLAGRQASLGSFIEDSQPLRGIAKSRNGVSTRNGASFLFRDDFGDDAPAADDDGLILQASVGGGAVHHHLGIGLAIVDVARGAEFLASEVPDQVVRD